MKLFKKLTEWYFTKRAVPYWCVLMLDCAIVVFSGLVASYVELGGLGFTNCFWQTLLGMVCCLPIFMGCFHLFHTYQGIIRFSSYVDLYRIAVSTFIGAVGSVLLGVAVNGWGGAEAASGMADGVRGRVVFPDFKAAFFIWIICTMLLWVVRLLVKASFETFRTDRALAAAIYGTQAGGMAIANSIGAVSEKQFDLRCFISDRKERAGIYLLGKRVFLNGEGIAQKLLKQGVKVLLVSPLKSAAFRNNQAMVNELTNAGIRIMMMPEAEDWDGKSDINIQHLHEVEIEDLLPRDEITVGMDAIGAMLQGKSVLITGAAGSIGSEMARQIAPYSPAQLVLVDQAETPMHDMRLWAEKFQSSQQPTANCQKLEIQTIVASITDKVHMEKLFSQYRPEYVFHAAAYKHVPMMEDNPAQAVRNNINGTRIIADLAVKYGTRKFVMISTDKAVNPTNVMGCSKRICEIYCQSLNKAIVDGKVKGETQFVTTRFGNVLGSNGSVIPLFREQIKNGGPITVTHPDIIRYFMLIPEACKLVLEAGTMGHGGEIFVFDMGNPVKIVDLAKRMIELSGAQDVQIQFTGLRDGEKLYEEVLCDAEGTIPTNNPKIMVAKVREYDYETAKANEDELLELSYSHDDMAIVRKMKDMVPEYKSKVSKYDVLDN